MPIGTPPLKKIVTRAPGMFSAFRAQEPHCLFDNRSHVGERFYRSNCEFYAEFYLNRNNKIYIVK